MLALDDARRARKNRVPVRPGCANPRLSFQREGFGHGDTDAFLDLFDTAGSVDDLGSICRGREEIRVWSDRELIGAKAAHFDLLSGEQQGNGASMMVQVGGDGFNGPSRFTFLLEDWHIRQMRITAD